MYRKIRSAEISEMHSMKICQLLQLIENTNMVENSTVWATYSHMCMYMCMNKLNSMGSWTNYKLLAYEIWYWFVATASYLFGTLFSHFVILSCFLVWADASLFLVCSPPILWKCLEYLWVVQNISVLNMWRTNQADIQRRLFGNTLNKWCADTKWYIVCTFYTTTRIL